MALSGLRPSAIPHLTPYIDVLHSHSSVIQKKKFGCGGWAFSSKARSKCVVSEAQTQARPPVAVPIRIRIVSPGATFLMLPAHTLCGSPDISGFQQNFARKLRSTRLFYERSRLGMCEGCMYTLLKVVHTHICALCDTLPSHVILFGTRSHVRAGCHKARS